MTIDQKTLELMSRLRQDSILYNSTVIFNNHFDQIREQLDYSPVKVTVVAPAKETSPYCTVHNLCIDLACQGTMRYKDLRAAADSLPGSRDIITVLYEGIYLGSPKQVNARRIDPHHWGEEGTRIAEIRFL